MARGFAPSLNPAQVVELLTAEQIVEVAVQPGERMDVREITQAIPPAYSEFIGKAALTAITARGNPWGRGRDV